MHQLGGGGLVGRGTEIVGPVVQSSRLHLTPFIVLLLPHRHSGSSEVLVYFLRFSKVNVFYGTSGEVGQLGEKEFLEGLV